MRFPGFVGGSYTLASIAGDLERSVNFYPEPVQSGFGKSPVTLRGTPGLTTFATCAAGNRIRGMIICYGVGSGGVPRVFAVSATNSGTGKLYEINSNGTTTDRGTLSASSWVGQAYMAYNETQLAIAFGPQELFILTFATNVLTQNASGFSPNQVVYMDGYFIANSSADGQRQRFYISALKNGLSWDLLDFEETDQEPDIIVSFLVAHNELWFFGQNGTQPYYNSGNTDFPFETIKGQFIEGGCGAQASAIKVGDTLIWMGHEVTGRGIVWKAEGYRLTRISTYAVEAAIRSYSGSPAGITDAVAWAYQDQGHIFYVLTFPTANKTWVYDLTTNLWHERMYWTGTAEAAHLGICSVFAFWETTPFQGIHLVGARNSGKIYKLVTSGTINDDGDTIRRIRRCPHLASEGKRNYYSAMEVELETGLASNQRLNLRWSDNGGKTYCAYKERNVGPALSSVTATAAAIVTAGTGYTLNDVLTVVGGNGTAATIRASAVSGGVITACTVISGGTYTGNPANPVSVTGGTGSGATFNLTIPGANTKRARWLRLGQARDKVFELMVEDPVDWTITDAFLEMESGQN